MIWQIGLDYKQASWFAQSAPHNSSTAPSPKFRVAQTVARDQLAGTVEQLKEAQGARERFFGNISHEIRTPLSLIMLTAG